MKIWFRIGLALLLVALTFGIVSAHAKLLKASPAPSSIVGTAPTQVQMWFDESLDLNFSQVQVLDSKKQRIDTGELQAVPGDPKSVIAPLKPSGDGTYNVVWTMLSATDGHITRGVFAYGVGNTAGSIAAPVDSGDSTTPNELSPLSATVRWLDLLAMLVIVGGLVFRFYLLEPSLDKVDANKNVLKIARVRWSQLLLVAFIFFIASNAAEVALEANLVAGSISFPSIASILINSRYGQLWGLRIGAMTLVGLGLWLETRRIRVPQADVILVVLGNVSLFARSLNSHSAAAGNFSLPVLADWLHLLCVSLWVGGLIALAWLMPFVWRALDPKTRSAWIARLIPQFSIMALAATPIIAITGLYNAAQQIPALNVVDTRTLPTLAQITAGIYDNALLAKIILFGVMIGFGALNLLFLSPRFRRFITEPDKSARLFSRFRVTVALEVLFGLSTIFLAGILTLSPPPRSEPTQQTAPVVDQQSAARTVLLVGYPANDVQVQLEIGPKPATPTTFTATVTDRNGATVPNVQRVIFNFMYLNQDTGAQNVNADAGTNNQYAVQGSYLTLDGMWKIRVTVRRQGLDDQFVEFPYYITPAIPEDVNSVMTAQLELTRAQQAMNSLKTLRSVQALNDGTNGVTVSHYDYQAPDKTQFSIEGQGTSIAIGANQYFQDKTGQWTERPRVDTFAFPKFDFATTAQSTRLGRQDKINNAPMQIIMFDTPNTSGSDLIHYAYWIQEDNKRVVQFAMSTTDHYMIQTYEDFDSGDIAITAPTNLAPVPTAAPVTDASSSVLTTAVQGTGRPRGFITGDLEGDGALVMVVAGVVVLLVGTGGKRARNARFVTLGIGAASVLLGVGLFIDAVNGTTAAIQSVPVNTVRASTGQQIYEQNCLVCHGVKGYGDGPAANSLPVKPFDLTTHVLLHDEQYLYATILNGRGSMPAWGNRLTQDQILDVIAYTRLLARNAQQGSPNATPRPGFTPQP